MGAEGICDKMCGLVQLRLVEVYLQELVVATFFLVYGAREVFLFLLGVLCTGRGCFVSCEFVAVGGFTKEAEGLHLASAIVYIYAETHSGTEHEQC